MANHNVKIICNYDGCSKDVLYNYTNKKDANIARVRYSNYLCAKHSRPNEMIERIDGLKKELVYEVIDGSFKRTDENHKSLKQIINNGFRIFAEDFKNGDIIKINVEVITKKESTLFFDDNGIEIFVGDILISDYGFSVIVYKDIDGLFSGKLICDDSHTCKDIPYSLNTGIGYKIKK